MKREKIKKREFLKLEMESKHTHTHNNPLVGDRFDQKKRFIES